MLNTENVVNALVEEHLPLVEHVVYQASVHFPRHVDVQELCRAGTIGLLEAARRFDETKGVPFPRFAAVRIKGAVLDAVRKADWAPRGVRADARKVEDAKQRLANELGQTPTLEQVAEATGFTARQVADLEGHVTRSVVLALDQTVAEIDGDEISMGDVLTDRTELGPDEMLEQREMHGYLRDAIKLLDGRHRTVIEGIFFEERTPQDLAEELGVSVSRISQIRTEALEMLKDGVTAQYDGRAQEPVPDKGRVARRRAVYAAAVASRSTWRTRLEPAEPVDAGDRRYA